MWIPNIERIPGPRYLAIVQALTNDIQEGRIELGSRLPTHRELAAKLKVTVGTVSRAYAEAERRGLTYGEVGRGTFVQGSLSSEVIPLPQKMDGLIDLAVMRSNELIYRDILSEGLLQLSQKTDLVKLLGYQPLAGLERHRKQALGWLAYCGVETRIENVVITSGAQHALAMAVAVLSESGELILTENMCYTGLIGIASQLHRRRLQGVETDEFGIIPNALEAACRNGQAKMLVCSPNLQNPTTSLMPEARRRVIAEIARRYNLKIVENDVFGFLVPNHAPPLAMLAPDRTCYINGITKATLPGIRVGFISAPSAWADLLAQAVRSSVWMPSPLMTELVCNWIEDGTAIELAQAQRSEAIARQQIAEQVLSRWEIQRNNNAYHLWLKLPEPWRCDALIREANNRGVMVVSGDMFSLGRSDSSLAIRICLMAPPTREEMTRGLEIINDLLGSVRPSHTMLT